MQGSGDTFIALLVYIDDIIIIGASSFAIDNLKLHLHGVFKLKDLNL